MIKMKDFPFFQDQKIVHSLTHSMIAKTGAPSPRTRLVPGLRGSTAAPRQKHPRSPLQPVTSLTLNQPCSQQHPLSPPAPARWEKSDTVPSGKTERRIANPPMNVWNQWVSRPLLPTPHPHHILEAKCTDHSGLPCLVAGQPQVGQSKRDTTREAEGGRTGGGHAEDAAEEARLTPCGGGLLLIDTRSTSDVLWKAGAAPLWQGL